MAFTAEENKKIIEGYWNGQARCPRDESSMELKQIRNLVNYTLVGACPRCRETVNAGTNADPLRDDFRDWTEEEQSEMADDYFKHGGSTCPVCNISVKVEPVKTPFWTQLLYFCPRCCKQGRHTEKPKA